MESSSKRRRSQRSPSPTYKLDDENDTFEPYVPVAHRRAQKLAKLASLASDSDRQRRKQQQELEEYEDAQKEEESHRERARMERTLLMEAQEVHSRRAAEGVYCWSFHPCFFPEVSFAIESKKTESQKAEEADAEILEAIKSRRKLASDMELAKGIQYTESLKSRYVLSSCMVWGDAKFI